MVPDRVKRFLAVVYLPERRELTFFESMSSLTKEPEPRWVRDRDCPAISIFFFKGKKTNKQTRKRGNVNRDKDQFKTFYCSLKVTSDGLAIIYQSVRDVKWVLLFALLHFLFVFVILRTDGRGGISFNWKL